MSDDTREETSVSAKASELTNDVRERLVRSVLENPKRCPACGSSRLGWDDDVVMPTVSKRNCKDCGCVWSPKWRTGHGWESMIAGSFLAALGIFMAAATGYQLVADEFEDVGGWHNTALPGSWWPYAQIAIGLVGLVLGLICIRKGRRVIRSRGSAPVIHEAGSKLRVGLGPEGAAAHSRG